jgi:hypothetical protein
MKTMAKADEKFLTIRSKAGHLQRAIRATAYSTVRGTLPIVGILLQDQDTPSKPESFRLEMNVAEATKLRDELTAQIEARVRLEKAGLTNW